MAKLQGGGSRDWLVPVKPDGRGLAHDTTVDIIGSHRGFYGGLNVARPRPNTQYQWVNANPRDIFQARQRGWEVVAATDEDSPAWTLAYDQDSDQPTPLDTSNVFHDSVLVRTSDENFRALQEANMRMAQAALDSSTETFLEGASQAERMTGRTQHGYVPTRLTRRDHSVSVRQGDEIIEHRGAGRSVED